MPAEFSDVLKKLNLPPATLQAFGDSKIEGVITKNAIKLTKDGAVIGAVPMSEVALNSLLQGTSSGLMTKAFKENLLALIQSVLQETAAPDSVLHVGVSPEQTAALKKGAVPTMPEDQLSMVAVGGAVPMFELSKMGTATPVYLKDATMLFQPVRGSDSSSRYFAVGIGPDIKVGVRWKHEKMSIRAEGNVMKYKEHLQAAGLNVHSEKYASTHLAVSGVLMGRKVIGAVLGCFAGAFHSAVPSADVIYGKGS